MHYIPPIQKNIWRLALFYTEKSDFRVILIRPTEAYTSNIL
jgi:hypothetical protein